MRRSVIHAFATARAILDTAIIVLRDDFIIIR